jgi:hypothetical protein
MRLKSIDAINTRGCLLVYPLSNRADPKSLWSELFPRTQMRWEWNQDGDNRVAELWHIRAELSESGDVVYAKWFQNRATFFSCDVFVNLLAFLGTTSHPLALHQNSRTILELLQQDSPQSTKQLKAAAELEGRLLEPTYNRAMKPLWQNLYIVGFGEFADSSFPSLGIGASELLFEELWSKAQDLTPQSAEQYLGTKLGDTNPFLKFARKLKS